MAEVASITPVEALRLQSDEITQYGLQLDDADFAYRLQLQEALKASAAGCEIECISLEEETQNDEQSTHNKLQVSSQLLE